MEPPTAPSWRSPDDELTLSPTLSPPTPSATCTSRSHRSSMLIADVPHARAATHKASPRTTIVAVADATAAAATTAPATPATITTRPATAADAVTALTPLTTAAAATVARALNAAMIVQATVHPLNSTAAKNATTPHVPRTTAASSEIHPAFHVTPTIATTAATALTPLTTAVATTVARALDAAMTVQATVHPLTSIAAKNATTRNEPRATAASNEVHPAFHVTPTISATAPVRVAAAQSVTRCDAASGGPAGTALTPAVAATPTVIASVAAASALAAASVRWATSVTHPLHCKLPERHTPMCVCMRCNDCLRRAPETVPEHRAKLAAIWSANASATIASPKARP